MPQDAEAVLFDSHTHLYVSAFDKDRAAVLARAQRSGVRQMLVVGIDLPSSAAAAALAQEAGLYATVGIQPHYAAQAGEGDIAEVGRLARASRVVAIGEIGLDYYRDRAPREDQRRLFRQQLGLAREMDLPVVIHSRNSLGDVLTVLLEAGRGLRGVMHCFSGTLEEARDFTALDFYVSIAGPVTYPRAAKTWRVAQEVALDRLLIETDCPWLPPQSRRGKRNEPAYLVEIATRIAELRGLTLEELAQITTQNAQTLFLNGGT